MLFYHEKGKKTMSFFVPSPFLPRVMNNPRDPAPEESDFLRISKRMRHGREEYDRVFSLAAKGFHHGYSRDS